MKKLLIAILMLCGAAHAAVAPNLSALSFNVSSGGAPLLVVGKLTATDATVSNVFSDLEYSCTVNDASGSWLYGRTTRSKKLKQGPVFAHVFETAGSHTVTCSVVNPVTRLSATKSTTITVSDWAADGTTACVNANSADFTGCPAGATQINQAGTGSWPTAVGYLTTGTPCVGSTAVCKRILLKRGDTFTGAANTSLAVVGPAMIGAYGSGAKPVIRTTGSVNGDGIGVLSGTITDLRLVDLDIDGQSDADVVAFKSSSVTASKLLFLRVDIHDIACGIDIEESQAAAKPDSIGIFDSTVTDRNSNGSSVCPIGIRVTGSNVAVMGNLIDGTTASTATEHGMRTHFISTGIVAHNTISNGQSAFSGGGSKEMFSLRAIDSVAGKWSLTGASIATQNLVVSDNKIVTNTYAGIDMTYSGDGSDTTLWTNVLIERNYLPATATGDQCMKIRGAGTVVRLNICTNNAGTTFGDGNIIAVKAGTSNVPHATGAQIYNNVCHTTRTGASYSCITTEASTSGAVIRNNIAYAPSADTPAVITDNASSTMSKNTGADVSTITTSPAFVNASGAFTASTDYRIGSGSPYDGTGTTSVPIMTDMDGCYRRTSEKPVGAFHFRESGVQCVGAP